MCRVNDKARVIRISQCLVDAQAVFHGAFRHAITSHTGSGKGERISWQVKSTGRAEAVLAHKCEHEALFLVFMSVSGAAQGASGCHLLPIA